MITVNEAKKIVETNTGILSPVAIPLIDAAGCVLAENVLSEIDSPSFNQAAMDGYAFAWDTVDLKSELPVFGNIPAGTTHQVFVVPGFVSKIFTGAPVPEGVDTIIMQESAEETEGGIKIIDEKISKGSNIRLKASQISKGEIAVKARTKLTPGVMGYLASLGVTEVSIYTVPKIGIIVTGKELVFPGTPLEFGQVYECNSMTLTSALFEGRMEPSFLELADDNEEQVAETISRGLQACDILLITGGISVGKYDFVQAALKRNNIETLFYKVKQKPGKPLFFGKQDDKLVFGLPGNPSAVLTCFYEYVVPCIRKMSGMKPVFLNEFSLPLSHDTYNKPGLTCFLKGKMIDNMVVLLNGQESYKLNAFTEADCLIVLDENKTEYQKGEQVVVHKINECWI